MNLFEFQEGDAVFITNPERNLWYGPVVLQKLKRKFFNIKGENYRINGQRVGHGAHLEMDTPELRAEITKIRNRKKSIASLFALDWKTLSDDAINKIMEIVCPNQNGNS